MSGEASGSLFGKLNRRDENGKEFLRIRAERTTKRHAPGESVR